MAWVTATPMRLSRRLWRKADAGLKNQDSAGFVAAEEAEAGMAAMSKVYDATGRELYMGSGDREHD